MYFDNQNGAQPTKEVVAAQIPYLSRHFTLADSYHKLSQQLLPKIREASVEIYKFVGATHQDHFVFTSSGAEAVNHVLFSTYLDVARKSGRNHFITTQLEEAPTILSLSRLTQLGASFEMACANSDSIITVDAIADLVSPRTSLISLSAANGLTGVIQPLDSIVELCRERGILLHVDATHLLGKAEFSFANSGIDFLTFNGAPFHGPRGSGGLFIKSDRELSPLILGDKSQAGMRAGGLDIAALMGLAKAAGQMMEHRETYSMEISRLRNYLEATLIKKLPNARVLFSNQKRVPNISLIHFGAIFSEALSFLLDQKGVYASFGGGNFQKISNLLKACFFSEKEQYSALSFALSREMTQESLDQAITHIVSAVTYLAKMTEKLEPFYVS